MYCSQLVNEIKLPYIKAIGIERELNINILKQHYISAQGLLLDSKTLEYGGSGQSFNWDLINKQDWINRDKPLILSGGINSQNIHQALALQPYAIDFSSSIEVAKGVKDHKKMQQIINQINKYEAKPHE
jgi:phosphoribosylanthranilate isomerase